MMVETVVETRISSPFPSPYSFGDFRSSLVTSEEEQGLQPAAPSSTYTQSVFLGLGDSKTLATSNEGSNRLSGDGDIIDTSSIFRRRSNYIVDDSRRCRHHSHGAFDADSCCCTRHCLARLPTSLSTPDVAHWHYLATSSPASRSQPALLDSKRHRQQGVSEPPIALRVKHLHQSESTKSNEVNSTLELQRHSHLVVGEDLPSGRSCLPSLPRPLSLVYSFKTGISSNFLLPRRATNSVSISRKFQPGRSSNVGIAGSFVIDPRITIPKEILRTFDSDFSLRARISSLKAEATKTGVSKDDQLVDQQRKPNLFLEVEHGAIDVDVELVPSMVSSKTEPTLVELKSKFLAPSFENIDINELSARIAAPHPRPAFHLRINCVIVVEPLPQSSLLEDLNKGRLSRSSRGLRRPLQTQRRLLQRHRPHNSETYAGASTQHSPQTTLAEPHKPLKSFICLSIPRTYHGPLTITTTIDFSSHDISTISPQVHLGNMLRGTTVLMSETTKPYTGGSGPGQKQKTGYFVHQLCEDMATVNEASMSDGSGHEEDAGWLFVTPSIPATTDDTPGLDGPNCHIGLHQEASPELESNHQNEWDGDRIDIRISFVCPSGSPTGTEIVPPEIWLKYTDEPDPFAPHTTSYMNKQDERFDKPVHGDGQIGITSAAIKREQRKGFRLMHWITCGCFF